jgi:hypothetical protein
MGPVAIARSKKRQTPVTEMTRVCENQQSTTPAMCESVRPESTRQPAFRSEPERPGPEQARGPEPEPGQRREPEPGREQRPEPRPGKLHPGKPGQPERSSLHRSRSEPEHSRSGPEPGSTSEPGPGSKPERVRSRPARGPGSKPEQVRSRPACRACSGPDGSSGDRLRRCSQRSTGRQPPQHSETSSSCSTPLQQVRNPGIADSRDTRTASPFRPKQEHPVSAHFMKARPSESVRSAFCG